MRHGKIVQFVQVAYTIDGVKTRKREVDPLAYVAKKTGCNDLLLITDHDHDTISEDGVSIKVVTAREWLLGQLGKGEEMELVKTKGEQFYE